MSISNLTKLLTANSVTFLSGVISTLIFASLYNEQAITLFAKITSASAIIISFSSLKFEKNIVGEKDQYSKKIAKFISLILPLLFILMFLTIVLGGELLGLVEMSSHDRTLIYFVALIATLSKVVDVYRNELLSQKRYTTLSKMQIFGATMNNVLQITLSQLGNAGLVLARAVSLTAQALFKKHQLSSSVITYTNALAYFKINLKRQLLFSLGSIITTLIGQSLIIYATFFSNTFSVASIFLAQRFISVPVSIFTKSSSLVNFQELSAMNQVDRAGFIQKRLKNAVVVAFSIFLFFYLLSFYNVFLSFKNIDSSVLQNFRWLLISSFFQIIFAPFGTLLWLPRNNISHLKVSLGRLAILLTFVSISHIFLPEYLLPFYVFGIALGYLFHYSIILKLLNES